MMFAVAAPLGLLAGLHAATWGAYKDAPFEGFRIHSSVRTVVLATVVSLIIAASAGLTGRLGVVVTLGAVYAVERLATEWWKAIVREDDQSAYTIPMRLGLHGRPLDNTLLRYGIGALLVLGLAAAGWLTGSLQLAFPDAPPWLLVATVGGAGGWATAVGGAWKDAPIEGFSGWKFLRSPAVATAWAVPLSLLTSNWVALLLASAGFAVASIETYKTFLTRGRPPGKFANRPVHHHLPALRQRLALLHAVLWGGFAVTLAATLNESTRGLTAAALGAIATPLPVYLLGAVAAYSACLSVLVVHGNVRINSPVGMS